MEPEEISVRLVRVNDVLRALKHAIENFDATDDLARKRSAFGDFLNRWAEFTWVMKAQLQIVAGDQARYVAWWEKAAQHIKADATCSYFWKLRPRAAHEGRLAVHTQLFVDETQQQMEQRIQSLPPKAGLSYALDSYVVIEDAPDPLNRFPARDLMIHARSMAIEIHTIALSGLRPAHKAVRLGPGR